MSGDHDSFLGLYGVRAPGDSALTRACLNHNALRVVLQGHLLRLARGTDYVDASSKPTSGGVGTIVASLWLESTVACRPASLAGAANEDDLPVLSAGTGTLLQGDSPLVLSASMLYK